MAGGFQVGMEDDVNGPAVPYYWVALSAKMPPSGVTADVEMISVNLTGPETASAGVPFTISGGPSLRNNGPAASVVVDTTFSPSFPPGCTATTGAHTVQNTTLTVGLITSLSRAWNVTCSVGGQHTFTLNVTVAIDPAESFTDPNLGNNSGSDTHVTQVN